MFISNSHTEQKKRQPSFSCPLRVNECVWNLFCLQFISFQLTRVCWCARTQQNSRIISINEWIMHACATTQKLSRSMGVSCIRRTVYTCTQSHENICRWLYRTRATAFIRLSTLNLPVLLLLCSVCGSPIAAKTMTTSKYNIFLAMQSNYSKRIHFVLWLAIIWYGSIYMFPISFIFQNEKWILSSTFYSCRCCVRCSCAVFNAWCINTNVRQCAQNLSFLSIGYNTIVHILHSQNKQICRSVQPMKLVGRLKFTMWDSVSKTHWDFSTWNRRYWWMTSSATKHSMAHCLVHIGILEIHEMTRKRERWTRYFYYTKWNIIESRRTDEFITKDD